LVSYVAAKGDRVVGRRDAIIFDIRVGYNLVLVLIIPNIQSDTLLEEFEDGMEIWRRFPLAASGWR
jgi:hypothetical protein